MSNKATKRFFQVMFGLTALTGIAAGIKIFITGYAEPYSAGMAYIIKALLFGCAFAIVTIAEVHNE